MENLNPKSTHRRNFLSTAAVTTAGAGVLAAQRTSGATLPQQDGEPHQRLPREVRIATVSQANIQEATAAAMTKRVMRELNEIAKQAPDIVCLPETHTAKVRDYPRHSEITEATYLSALEPYAYYAKKHRCYVVCPIHTTENGKCYNSAVFLDREGDVLGRYHKKHTTTNEMSKGVSPGPAQAPVFDTDFGKVGAQICFDIHWTDGWQDLSAQGAEIVFWPSAFGGGEMVRTMAWQHQYCVVSSTWKGASRICDVTGNELAKTGLWNQWAVATVNLEREFLHTWPYVRCFGEILAKYGSKIRIENHEEEEWSIIESRSADLRIDEVMHEFELKSLRDHLAEATAMQDKLRS
ncbi:MAG: hypothetical protein Aurels2KO_45670 [Aureliella sp.]